jgi:hypothetical protein
LRKKEENNASLIRIHQAKVVEHLKLRKRRRFVSVKELEGFFGAKDLLAGICLVMWNKCNLKFVKPGVIE